MSTLLLLTLSSPANAFAPSEDVYIGIEPNRIHHVNPERQHRLQTSHMWQAFAQGEGAGWQAVFDERAGTVYRMWGPGIAVDAADASTLEEELRSFFERNPELTGVSQAELVLTDANYVERLDTWYVHFDRMVEEVPVWRGGVEVRVRGGEILLMGLETHPRATLGEAGNDLAARTRLTADQAIDASIELGPEPAIQHEVDGARLVLLPSNSGPGLAYQLCWETRTRTHDVPGIWVSHIDAATGQLVNVYNEVRFLQGSVDAEHHVRTVNGEFMTSGVPLANVEGGLDSTRTDWAGLFDLDDDGPFTTELSGSYVRIQNDDGDEALGTFDDDFTWTTDDATQAEIDSYVFLHHVKDWGEVYAPEVEQVSDRQTSIVNINSSCNAYWDGNTNFYKAGGGCNNTGQIADVNYHEWGHGFHYWSLESGSFDGSISEGIGDIVSALQTDDHIMAPYFSTGGSGIRELSTDYSYPDDVTGEVHQDGLIFAGAMWDWWDILGDEIGRDEANAVVSQALADGIKGGPDIAASFDEIALVTDSEFTCSLLEAFGRHGLGPGGAGGTFWVGHTPVQNQSPGVEIALDASVTSLAPECYELDVDTAKLHWSIDAGETWEVADMTVSGDDSVSGAIPAQDPGTLVHYFLSVEDDEGQNAYSPSGGTINPHTFYVGDLVEIYCEDFEDDDGGFTHELLSGDVTDGADDWQWGEPTGKGGDPDFAFSGNSVWANDLGQTIGQQEWNGEYQNEKHNRLTSVAIDTTGHTELVLQYRRWLTVEDGYYDTARILIDGEERWMNHQTDRNVGDEHHQDDQWALHTLPFDDTDGTVQFSWEIESDGGLSFGGWTLDDVCVYGVSYEGAPDDGPGTGDLDGEGDVTLTPTGCGCASTSPTGLGFAGLVFGLALVIRRRR
ncbi:MAG: hypothetical protein GY913_25710 [Proteobacteria bacterium]|nr:hypothetical protein [Pseudomonadota bacterium]